MTVVCSSAVLCFYCHWLCSTDIAVGLLVKRQQNGSTYGKSVTVTEMVFIKRTVAWEVFVKTALANCIKIQQLIKLRCYVADGRVSSARNNSLFL